MNCPHCTVKIDQNKVTTILQDGGILVLVKCNRCGKTHEVFISPTDFEESFEQ